MKYLNFNKILLGVAVASIALNGCKKVIVPEDLGGRGQKIVSFIDYGSLAAFSASSLIVDLSQPLESQEVYLKYSGPTVFGNDITATVSYDDAALTAYNASVPPGGLTYTKMPADFYKIVNPIVKIPAGTAISEALKIEIYSNKLDPAVSYMFPLTITTITGASSDVKPAPATATAYFHIIGNPLAGNYLRDFYRWNGTTDTTTAPNSTVTIGTPQTLGPVGPKTLLLPESYLTTFTGQGITFDFDNNAGALSNFRVSLTPSALAAITAGGFTIITAPVLVRAQLVGNAGTKFAGSRFRTYMVIQNSTPAIRTVIDEWVKQ